jgi:hypothetical protein
MAVNRFGFASGLLGVVVGAAIIAAPVAAATTIEPAPVMPDTGAHAVQKAPVTGGGAVALPPGGPVAVLPGDSAIGGADPYLPSGTDPLVPYGVWSQSG